MCGIAGFFGHRAVSPTVSERMMAELRRRGPDAQHHIAWDADFRPTSSEAANALLHARLSIIDPRPEADQPMPNEAGDIWICYNGEVYDWQREAAALRDRGYRFRTRSDTEFILRAYEEWGLGCVERLRGMFAFAILDLRQRKLHIVRDRMGLKPLVYYHQGDEFAFASTVRALLPYLPPQSRHVSPEGIDAYLAHRYIPAPRTIFTQISRLENGHALTFDLHTGQLQKRRYWQPEPVLGDWREALDEAIRIRTVADRPLGLFLSGGVDSSVLAQRLAAQGHADLRSFSAAFPEDSGMDESTQARTFADALGMPNEAVPIPRHIESDFARIVADLDEPFADPSSFPTWYLARSTSEQVKVVLGGDGGDELFAGYKRIAKHLRSAWRGRMRLPLGRVHPSLNGKGWAKLRTELGMTWAEAYSLRFSGFTPNQRAYLQPGWALPQLTYWRNTETTARLPRDVLLQIDLDNYLPEYILRKADLCTMAHGLELRAPLLDHHWYQCLLAVPDVDRFTSPPKRLLGQVCEGCVRLGVFERKKRGFNPPLRHWLQIDLADRFPGLGKRLMETTHGQLDARAVDAMCVEYRAGSHYLAEQVLQLLILDESLCQLAAACAYPSSTEAGTIPASGT